MPPALDRAPRRRRPRSRPTPQGLLAAARTAPARPLSTASRPPRVTNVRHAAVRASHFVPGVSDARQQPRPLQAQPPRRPLGARPGGKARGVTTRRARRRELTRVADQLLTRNETPAAPKKRSFIQNLLSASSPVGQSVREGRINPIDVVSTVAGRVASNVAQVVAKDPGKQLPKLLKDTGESIVSIPAGVVRTATDPKGAAEGIVTDYSRRYKPLLEGDDKAFQARLKKEGVAPEVFDLAGLASAEGGIAGRALQKAAEAGTLGKTAARVATTRPGLRVSGGLVKPQPVSNNFFRNVVRAGVDTARQSTQTRRASGRQASALVREAETQGQVTPVFRTTGMQRRSVAQAKGRQLTAMKAEQQAQVGASTKAIGSLSKPERRAFKYAMQYGATTPETGRRVLTAHKARLMENRPAHERVTGETIPERQNEIPEVDYLLGNADKAFTPKLAQVMRQERARAVVSALGDPGVDAAQAEARRTLPQRELLQLHMGGVSREAAGLEEPGYFPSEKRPEGVFSTFAVGGKQAVQAPKPYTGALTRTGRESTALDVLPRGIARNIKRKYNWNLVASNFDRHAYGWSKGKTIEQLKDDMERRGIDPGSVAFWNPKKFREAQQEAGRIEGPDVEAGQATPEAQDVHGAAQLATNPAAFKDSPGWSLIPKAVHDEIMTDIRPSGLVGRGVDIAKGKLSRAMLAAPGWLQYQVASNALLTGLSGTGPVDAVKAQVWWRKLPKEQQDAIAPYIGVHKWYDDQTHLGAAGSKLPSVAGKFVDAWRAFKQTRFYRHPLSPRPGNVFDTLFKADNAQNNFFRKAVFYNKAKRETYRRMGEQAGKIITLQDRAMHVLSLPPEKQMEAAIKDADTFERIAEHTNNFLGDYTTYTTAERRTLGRPVMFYGFLRFSVKFTLYTMPIEHPLVSSILTQIGRLERDEQKKIFGADVPPWELGNLYTKDGRKYQLSRLSPFFNAIQYGEPGSLTASLSPLIQVALNQAASKDVTFQRPFTIKGSGQYVEKSLPGSPLAAVVPGTTRNKIALEELLKLSPYYRLAEKTGVPGVAAPLSGKQTSESGILWPDPVKYKMTTKQSRDAAARNEQTKRDQAAGGPSRQAREQLLPLLGLRGEDTIRKAREFDKAAKKKKRKKKTGPPDLLGGGGSSVQLPDLLGP